MAENNKIGGSMGSYSMIPSKGAYDIIKKFEGLRLTPYECAAGHATIGWGHLLHSGKLTEADRKIIWTEEHADLMLEVAVIRVAQDLNKLIKVPVKQTEFDALCSWTYNLGIGSAKQSSWLRELNKGNYKDVPRLMSLWNKVRVNGVLVESKGLKNRREQEANLFNNIINN